MTPAQPTKGAHRIKGISQKLVFMTYKLKALEQFIKMQQPTEFIGTFNICVQY